MAAARTDTHARIHAVVRRIPRGRVATYGQVAALAGLGAQPRLVGYAMAALPDDGAVPWHRVVNAQGRVSPRANPGGDALQRALLEREGVRFDRAGRLDLERHRWRPRSPDRSDRLRAGGRPMARSTWLVKSEPTTYSFARLVAEGRTVWDGVRNPLARSHLAAMKKGDLVLYYHSNQGKDVVGIARVAREAYPDPTEKSGKWLAVDLEPVKPLAEPVELATIKADPKLEGLALIRQSRLSVMPVAKEHFERILALAKTKAPR